MGGPVTFAPLTASVDIVKVFLWKCLLEKQSLCLLLPGYLVPREKFNKQLGYGGW